MKEAVKLNMLALRRKWILEPQSTSSLYQPLILLIWGSFLSSYPLRKLKHLTRSRFHKIQNGLEHNFPLELDLALKENRLIWWSFKFTANWMRWNSETPDYSLLLEIGLVYFYFYLQLKTRQHRKMSGFLAHPAYLLKKYVDKF